MGGVDIYIPYNISAGDLIPEISSELTQYAIFEKTQIMPYFNKDEGVSINEYANALEALYRALEVNDLFEAFKNVIWTRFVKGEGNIRISHYYEEKKKRLHIGLVLPIGMLENFDHLVNAISQAKFAALLERDFGYRSPEFKSWEDSFSENLSLETI